MEVGRRGCLGVTLMIYHQIMRRKSSGHMIHRYFESVLYMRVDADSTQTPAASDTGHEEKPASGSARDGIIPIEDLSDEEMQDEDDEYQYEDDLGQEYGSDGTSLPQTSLEYADNTGSNKDMEENRLTSDPYAGIFFSKDRVEDVIESVDPDVVVEVDVPGSAEKIPVRVLGSGEWMSGCPEGSESSIT
jgi:hypothetical protein